MQQLQAQPDRVTATIELNLQWEVDQAIFGEATNCT